MLYDGTEATPSGGSDVTVAVLDTGYRPHPDLDQRVVDCKDFSQRKASVVEDTCEDTNGHGSHVAGIIAADGGVDHLGIYGVAPEASLYIYKVCGKNGSCWADDIATAVTHAVDAGAHVLNLSLGADNSSTLIADAIAYAADKNVLVVAAAGNDGPYEDSIDYPAALETVVAVGALDETATIATWSSRGINESTTQGIIEERDIELAAPGVNVESTYYTGGYAILSGTSMASPHIAGLAAKLWQGDAVATRDLLRSLTLPVDLGESGDDNAYGWGLPQL
jgi:subtilisin